MAARHNRPVSAPKAINEGSLHTQPAETRTRRCCVPNVTSGFPHSTGTNVAEPQAAPSGAEGDAGLKAKPHHLNSISQRAEGAPA